MLVFPPNPNSGDMFDPGGGLPTWLWDGQKWTHPSLPVLPQALEITTASLPQATAGVAYSAQLEATGGTPPYVWTMIGGSAEWASISSDGAVTGTPAGSGTQNVVARVTDSRLKEVDAVVDIAVSVPSGPLTITTTAFPAGLISFTAMTPLQLEATGGTPPYTWVDVSGQLPNFGFNLSSSGLLTGVSVAARNNTVQVRVTDSASTSVQRGFSLVVTAFVGPLQGIFYQGTPFKAEYSNGETFYSGNFYPIGGTAPYTWSIEKNQEWVRLDILGNRVQLYFPMDVRFTGHVDVTLTLRDSTNATFTYHIAFDVILGPLVFVLPTTLAPLNVGSGWATGVQTIGGTPNFVLTATGVPPGLTTTSPVANSQYGGYFGGTPTEEGDFNTVLTMTDRGGAGDSVSKSFSIHVDPVLPLIVSDVSGWADTADGIGSYYISLSATGGHQPLTWSLTGNGYFPGSYTFDDVNGAIYGDAGSGNEGNFEIEFMVTDYLGATATAWARLEVVNSGGDGEPPIYDQYHDGGVEEQKATPPTPTEAPPKKPAPRKNATHRKSPPPRKKGK